MYKSGNRPVIVFGLDHYNSLGLARVFGINGICPIGILVSCYEKHKYDFCYLSRYWKETHFVSTMNDGENFILENYSGTGAVIMPSADGAEEAIDNNLDELISHGFIVPGINQTQGEVIRLMNKMTQAEWVKSIGIKTADTFLIDLYSATDVNDFPYPCIVKPVLSSDGKKADITKCDDSNRLIQCLEELKKKGYKRILLQNFIEKDYEAELFGCITRKKQFMPFLLTRHLREWPKIGGSVSCHEFITDVKLKAQAKEILEKLQASGYEGNIDIELFVVNGEIFLNEINFRNSGDIYACFYNKIYYPLMLYMVCSGQEPLAFDSEYLGDRYAMNETTDFRHVLSGDLSFKDWLYFFRNTKDFAIKFKGDMKPAYKRYRYYIAQFLHRRK